MDINPAFLRHRRGTTSRRLAMSDDQMDTHAGGYYSIHRRGEVRHGILALVSTICGGGSLSIPWAFAKSGIVAGLAILCTSAALSALGVHFLLGGARRAGGLRTFDQVLEAALGPWARSLTIWSVVATCFLTLVANSLLLRQLVVPLTAEYVLLRPLSRTEEVVLGSSLVGMVIPLTFMTTLNSLRHVSLVSVTTVFALVLVLAYKGFGCAPADSSPPVDAVAAVASADTLTLLAHASKVALHAPPPPPLLLVSTSLSNLVSSLPVFVCIFICSFSALPLDTELRKPSRRRMTTMVIGAFSVALGLYAIAGLAGLYYGRCTAQPVTSNVLAMFPKGDGVASVLRVLLSFVLVLSLPLICLPCRNMIHQLLHGLRNDCLRNNCCNVPLLALGSISPALGQRLRMSGDDAEADDDYFCYSSDEDGTPRLARWQFEDMQPPAKQAAAKQAAAAGGNGDGNGRGTAGAVRIRRTSSVGEVFGTLVKEDVAMTDLPLGTRVLLSSCIMTASLVCTACVDDVSVVWGFLGSTCGILLSYVLPAASYLLLRRTPKPTTNTDGQPRRAKTSVPMRKLAALVLVIVGLVLIPITLAQAVQQLNKKVLTHD